MSDPEAIREDIAVQREALAETVDALHDKLDVKSHAKTAVADVKDRATTDSGAPRPELLAAAAGIVVLVGLLIWRKRR